MTIHFGGDPAQPNFIYTPEGWRYLVRLYGTREPINDGSFQFPEPEPVVWGVSDGVPDVGHCVGRTLRSSLTPSS